MLCQKGEAEIKEYVTEVIEDIKQHKGLKGFALGSGNSIPEYVPVAGYLAMVNKARETRNKLAED